MRKGSSSELQHGAAGAAGGCGCIPHSEQQGESPVISGCVCAGVDKVVQHSRTRRLGDMAKVIAFAALIIGLVVALLLWR